MEGFLILAMVFLAGPPAPESGQVADLFRIGESRPAPMPQSPAVPGARPAPIPAPVRYRLADASGQVWESVDPAALAAHVQNLNQNRAWSAPIYQAPAQPARWTFFPARTCAGNSCSR